MARYASGTDVSVEKSRLEIKALIDKYGATSTAFFDSADKAIVVFEAKSRRIMFTLPLPHKDSVTFCVNGRGAKRTPEGARKAWEQACRQKWRALLLLIKAKLEAVESGITLFEDEFLAQTVMPDGRTVSDHTRAAITRAYETNTMMPLLGGPK